MYQLLADLFPVANRIVSAEWDGATVGREDANAALHDLFDVECPGIQEVLDGDLEYVVLQVIDVVWEIETWPTGAFELAGSSLGARDSRGGPQAFQGFLDVGCIRRLGQRAVGDVVQVLVDVQEARQRSDVVAVHEQVGIDLAAGEAAGYRDEILQDETAGGLVDNTVDDVRYGDAGHGVELYVAADVGDGLEHHAANGRVTEAELDYWPHLVGVDVPLDGGDEDGGHAGAGKTVEGAHLGFQQGFASNRDVGIVAEAVELEVDDGIERSHLGEESIVVGEANAVGVDHHLANAPVLGCLDHFRQLGMYGWLASAELHDLGVAFDLDEAVEHGLYLFEGEVVAYGGVSEADRAVEVAGGVDLDEGEADVLLVFGAEAAIERAAVVDLGAEVEGYSAGLVETDAADVHLGVGADDALKPTVFGASLAHVDLVVADDYLGVYDRLAFRANGAGEFVKDIVGILLGMVSGGQLYSLLAMRIAVYPA